MLSNPLLITCGGSWAARRHRRAPERPASASSADHTAVRFSLRVIGLPPHALLARSDRHRASAFLRWHPSLRRVSSTCQASRTDVRQRRASVRRKLVRPELPPDLPDLVAPLLAQRVGGHHVVVATVLEHLEHLDGGLLEQARRRRGTPRARAATDGGGSSARSRRLGPPIDGQGLRRPGFLSSARSMSLVL